MVPMFTCGLVRSNSAANPRLKFNAKRWFWHRDANTVEVLVATRENMVARNDTYQIECDKTTRILRGLLDCTVAMAFPRCYGREWKKIATSSEPRKILTSGEWQTTMAARRDSRLETCSLEVSRRPEDL